MSLPGDIPRLRHSATGQALDDAQWAAYREACLDRTLTLDDLRGWLADRGVRVSVSAVHRDRTAIRVEDARERLHDTAEAARQIARSMGDGGGIADAQAVTVQLWTQRVYDYLIGLGPDAIDTGDLTRVANLGKALASLTGSEITRYRAEVERRSREASDQAKAIAAESTGDVRTRLNALAESILGVGR